MKRKKLALVLILTAAVIIVLGTVAAIVASKLSQTLDAYLQQVDLQPVDLGDIENGTYAGKTDAGIIQVLLTVEIRNHAITGIDLLEHRNGRGKEGERVLDEIIARQNTLVDTVSGATYSSIAIMDAVQDALVSLDRVE